MSETNFHHIPASPEPLAKDDGRRFQVHPQTSFHDDVAFVAWALENEHLIDDYVHAYEIYKAGAKRQREADLSFINVVGRQMTLVGQRMVAQHIMDRMQDERLVTV